MDLTPDSQDGVQDLVLLSELTEAALISNLKSRFAKEKVYTATGEVIISLNPYKKLPLYTQEVIEEYRTKNALELPPHVFSLGDRAFRSMRDRNLDQCVIITGESGSGKTEASKIFLKYIAAISGNQETSRIKDQLLESNPILESFGNSKTLKNDNSSRFGKYMDIQFDYKCNPCGASITTYLLEKSRVIKPEEGERNFHIFYQLLAGADDKLLKRHELMRDPGQYNILAGSSCRSIEGIDDAKEFQALVKALNTLGISKSNQDSLFEGLAAILHLGNVEFVDSKPDGSKVANPDVLEKAAAALGVPAAELAKSLTTRIIEEKMKDSKNIISSPIDAEKALLSRNALLKTLYSRLFDFLVASLNFNMSSAKVGDKDKRLVGVLDIYGFEVFAKNGFEQFIINYCNEKLQQVFIELVLKTAQEEYQREGIEWVQISYFNNAVICDLIEENSKGLISVLNDECLRPGNASDKTFLTKLNANMAKHAHYDSKEKSKQNKTIASDVFRLKHYAGEVDYSVEGFLEKNNDQINRGVLYTVNESSKPFFKALFPENQSQGKLKRPDPLSTQFKASMTLLVKNLSAKNPHYIRCVKPNIHKSPKEFDDKLVKHQALYLGMLENVRVRRAGFCFQQPYAKFLDRYKCLCPETWPTWNRDAREGVVTLLKHLNLGTAEYALGHTKIFIRNVASLYSMEAARNQSKNRLATVIQKHFRCHVAKTKFAKNKKALIHVQANLRRHLARQRYRKILASLLMVSKLIKGYLARKEYRKMLVRSPKHGVPLIQRVYRKHKARVHLAALAAAIRASPKGWRHVTWPSSLKIKAGPAVDKSLIGMYKRIEAKKYRKALNPAKKEALEVKSRCMNDLLGKKDGVSTTVGQGFLGDSLKVLVNPAWSKISSETTVVLSTAVQKLHRHALVKRVPRVLVVTPTTLHLLTPGLGSKVSHPLTSVTKIFVSPFQDGLIVLTFKEDVKGDLVVLLETPQALCELVGQLGVLTRKAGGPGPTVIVGAKGDVKVGNAQISLGFVKEPVKGGPIGVKKVGGAYQVSVG